MEKTDGVVLHSIPYAENGLIIKIYTRGYGLVSYVISLGKNRKNRKMALLQPLSLVQLISTPPESGKLARITNLESLYPYQALLVDPIKRTIALFLAEVLYRSIKEDQPDPDLFDFLQHSLRILDMTEDNCANFHLVFLLQLSRFYGFYPQEPGAGVAGYFDLQEGRFQLSKPAHPHFLNAQLSVQLQRLMGLNFERSGELKLPNHDRKYLLSGLVNYFRYHVPNFGELRSVKVLEEIVS